MEAAAAAQIAATAIRSSRQLLRRPFAAAAVAAVAGIAGTVAARRHFNDREDETRGKRAGRRDERSNR
jgi:hypothetical protein